MIATRLDNLVPGDLVVIPERYVLLDSENKTMLVMASIFDKKVLKRVSFQQSEWMPPGARRLGYVVALSNTGVYVIVVCEQRALNGPEYYVDWYIDGTWIDSNSSNISLGVVLNAEKLSVI